MGEVMEGAMQQAPQSDRQPMGGDGCAAAMAEIRLEAVGNQQVVKVE
jgi:hypothetical protein